MNLYELTQEAAAIVAELEANDGEITEQLAELMKIHEWDAAAKMEQYARAIANMQAMIEACKAERDRIYSKEKTAINAIDRMKSAMLQYMQYSDNKKINAGTFTISVRKSASVIIDDENALPAEYKKTETITKIDKLAVKNALKVGAVSGARIQENENINIK